jgi:tetratricopeptide (TPR) repeat protein
MPGVELERPGIDEVDATAPTFRRRAALAVVLITLLGSIVGYLQQRASNQEDNAARDAQIAAITGLGTQVQATTDFRSEYGIFVESELLDRRFIEATNRQRRAPAGSADADRFGREAARWAAVRDVVTPLTELGDDGFLVEDRVEPSLLEAELDVAPDQARLEQVVLADRADDFGGKADRYVAVLAVLAVSLFLIGLSLTVSGRSRYFLAAPGLVIAVVCLGWTAVIALQGTTEVSAQAVRLTAAGTRLATQGDIDGAIDRYTEAIETSPEFATAYARRSDAHFEAGAPQTLTGFISFVDPEALRRSIADAERALELGATDVDLLANLGFTLFLDGRFDRAVELSQQALDANDRLASVWFNLGVAEVARGNAAAAVDAYAEGLDLLDDEVDTGVRSQIFSGARNDLVLVRDLADGRDELAERIEGDLAAAEAGLNPADDDFAADVRAADVDEAVDEVTLERATDDPVFMVARFERGDLDERTPLALLWYYRASDDDPFEQLPGMKNFIRAGAGPEVEALATVNECLPAGEYRVEVYAGDDRIGSGEGAVETGPLGIVSNFSSEADALSLCVPSEWTRSRLSEAGDTTGAVQDGPLFLERDGPGFFGVTSFSTSVQDRATPEQTMDEAITTLLGPDADIRDDSVLATDGDEFFDLPARIGVLDAADGVTIVLSSLGPEPDGVLRIAIGFAADLEVADTIRAEMLDTMVFLQVRRA